MKMPPFLGCVLLLIFFSSETLAVSPDSANEFVAKLGARAFTLLNDDNISDEERVTNFRTLLNEGFDIPLIARYALGRYWRRASPQQKNEYIILFESFIVNSYAARLGEIGSEALSVTFSVTGAKTTESGDFIVSSTIDSPKQPPVKIDWRVRPSNAGLKIVDVILEGISMVITQRDEFSSVIQRSGGSLDVLIKRLRTVTAN